MDNLNDFITSQDFLDANEKKALLANLIDAPIERRLAITLLLYTGARGAELVGENATDKPEDPKVKWTELHGVRPCDIKITFRKATVFIQGAKGSFDADMLIPMALAKELVAYADAKGIAPGARLFDVCCRQLRNWWYLHRPSDKRIHVLRHTLGTEVYAMTKETKKVAWALRLRNEANARFYSHIANAQQVLDNVMRQRHRNLNRLKKAAV